MARTAAGLVIGNEILTGKIQEQNVTVLARELFDLGISLKRVIVCPDHLEVIVRDLNELRTTHDLVFTSGGIGPTHDDITIDAVAAAFGRPLIRSTEVVAMIRRHWGDTATEDHFRMANMPEGAELIRSADMPWPTIAIENVFLLPGVPQIFAAKLNVIRERLRGDTPFISHSVYTHCDEGEIAELLAQLVEAHPDVTIGSYPRFRDPAYKVKLTFDGKDPEAVQRAADALVAALAPERFVRRE